MISPDEALRLVIERAEALAQLGTERVPCERACGRVLAEPVMADRDIPPFHRIHMDGYACLAESVAAGQWLDVTGEVRAGTFSEQPIPPGTCYQVMTGAPLPQGADTIVPVEEVESRGSQVRFHSLPAPGRHIARRGGDYRSGARLLESGTSLTPNGVAVLATVGVTEVEVFHRPTIALVATGDEVVAAAEAPGPSQIRDSNTSSLEAQARLAGCDVLTRQHARDQDDELKAVLEAALEQDIVIISGGVSLGQYDLVPEVLQELGVEVVFHEVAQKPGKPLWFGQRGSTLVFGAPGNPLATVLSFDRYILPAIRVLSHLPARRAHLHGRLTGGIKAKKGHRETFFFCHCAWDLEHSEYQVTPLQRSGAADVFGTAKANATLRLQPGEHREVGDVVPFELLGS